MTAQITPVSYTFGAAAAVVGVSIDVIRAAYHAGDLIAHFPTSRPVILADDLKAWIAATPTERVTADADVTS